MKKLLTLLFIFLSSFAHSQWTTYNLPSAGRYDDIFFINENTGWTCNALGSIYKTNDAGLNWNLQTTLPDYIRCIEFATPLIGFAGGLTNNLFKTIDGGVSWTNITNLINPIPAGICGLAIPKPNVIYGVGIYASPAFLVKSVDTGKTWIYKDMSAFASALVDVNFVSADTGFVTGVSNPASGGGVILYTTDGGLNWVVKHKTLISEEWIWKIQSPDKKNYFASIQSQEFSADNVRMLKSTDRGLTWTTIIVSKSYSYIQSVGFLDSLTGWIGGGIGKNVLFQTIDGGTNWLDISFGGSYNRFFKVNDSTAYLTGDKIYKYRKGTVGGIIDKTPYKEIHSINVSPNPTNDIINLKVDLNSRTICQIFLIDQEGKKVHTFFDARTEIGTKDFTYSMSKYAKGVYYILLNTNEGHFSKKFVKQ